MSIERIREQFGAEAEAYVRSKVHARGASLGRMVELVEPQPEWQVLDIATGAGHTAIAFAPHVARVVATDITAEMLEQAEALIAERGLENIIIEMADAGALPYDAGAFDLVTCRIAPHHFTDIPLFISEAARVLRTGGTLAVVDNVVPQGPPGDYVNALEKLRDPSHNRCWSVEEWLAALHEARLRPVHQEILTKEMEFEFWAKRHDPDMQAYLLAMLSESSGATVEFLKPQFGANDTVFRLMEGILISRK